VHNKPHILQITFTQPLKDSQVTDLPLVPLSLVLAHLLLCFFFFVLLCVLLFTLLLSACSLISPFFLCALPCDPIFKNLPQDLLISLFLISQSSFLFPMSRSHISLFIHLLYGYLKNCESMQPIIFLPLYNSYTAMTACQCCWLP